MKVADRQRLPAQAGVKGHLVAFILQLLMLGGQRNLELALPLFPRRDAQRVDGQPGIRQHRLPFRQRTRRSRHRIVLWELIKADGVQVDGGGMQLPATRM